MSFQDLCATSMTKFRGKQIAIPQQGKRHLHGEAAFPLPCALQQQTDKARANFFFVLEKCHGIARAIESLRGVRLLVVSHSG
jgi:hypothetical protein